jgi:hypothetical protein
MGVFDLNREESIWVCKSTDFGREGQVLAHRSSPYSQKPQEQDSQVSRVYLIESTSHIALSAQQSLLFAV